MVHQRKIKRCCIDHEGAIFKPQGLPLVNLEVVKLTKEEITAIYYADLEGKKQKEAAESMNISQSTFSRDLQTAHNKIADALLNNKALELVKT